MDFFKNLLDACSDVWGAVVSRPKSFVLIGAVLLVVGYVVATWYYSGRISDMETRLALRDEQMEQLKVTTASGPSRADSSSAGTAAIGAFATWGGGDLVRPCVADIDTSKLGSFEGGFNIALLCGLTRTNVDRVTDRAISKSPALTIDSQRPLHIEAPLGREYLNVLISIVKSTPDGFEATPLPPGISPVLSMSIWHELVLLPKGITTESILSLSDVDRVGGRRHSSAGINASLLFKKAKEFVNGTTK